MLAYYGMNDAIGCFDGIDHTPAIITLMQFELEHNATHTLFQIMKKFLHHTKIGYDISGPVYSDKSVLLAGCGQGNGLSLTLWALISTVILIMCKKAGNKINFVTSITKLPISFIGYLFVDNADIVQGSNNVNISVKSLLPKFKELMKQ